MPDDKLPPETPEVKIEYTAKPRRFVLKTNPETGELEESLQEYSPPLAPFELRRLMPLGSVDTIKRGPYYVAIDDMPYAAYRTMREANEAAKLWGGYINGDGLPVTETGSNTFPASEGRIIRTIDVTHKM